MNHRRIFPNVAIFMVAAFAAASCGTDANTAADDTPLTCANQKDEIVQLLRSGLPAYDYDPLETDKELLQQSEIVVFGSIDSVTRDASGGGWTIAALSDAEIVYPVGSTKTIAEIAWSSVWADSSTADPLATVVAMDGLEMVAFLATHEAAPGGLTPHIQGFAVACAGSSDAAIAVQEPLPKGAAGMSLDQLRESIGSLAINLAEAPS